MDKKGFDKMAAGGGFGLEKESLRISVRTGRIADTDHPFPGEKHFSRDFAESQLEIITPVVNSPGELYRTALELQTEALHRLSLRGETLFHSSNPPAYDSGEVRIAHFSDDEISGEVYRRYLLHKYGLGKMLLSGIHFNYSYPSGAPDLCGMTADGLYLKAAAYAMKYAWLVTYLFAASPESGDPFYASVRCGEEGYWNDFLPVLDYSSLSAYCDSIDGFVESGLLTGASELYLPVRLKPRGSNSAGALRGGIDHIELRMIDVNPLDPAGIREEDLSFLHLLLLWFPHLPDLVPSREEQKAYLLNMKAAALYDDTGVLIREGQIAGPVRESALYTLALMSCTFERYGCYEALEIIGKQRRKLLGDGQRYAERVCVQCANYLRSAPVTA